MTLTVTDLSKKYRGQTILSDISFCLSEGECLGLIGPNGAGKTTLLRLLAGVLKPDSGSIWLDSHSVSDSHYWSRTVGYVPQENPLFDNLTVKDNLALWYCDTARKISEDAKDGLITRFGVHAYMNKRVSTLSGGMRKRLSIVCALAKNPKLLILDEPGASLDITAKEDICQYITEFTKEGGIAILATHEATEIGICTRTLHISGQESEL